MFCPQCKNEYRAGFTRCSDCNVNLVHALPTNVNPATLVADSSRTIWTGDREEDCVAFCRELREIGIPYRVAQAEVSRSFRMATVWRYEIAVASSDYEKAKDLLQIDDPESTSSFEEKATTSGNDSVVTELESEEDNGKDEYAERRAYSEDWFPEEATIEIWTRSVAAKDRAFKIDETSMVELSLKENLIHFRSDCNGDGVCRLFVMPEDEVRAREIVREIEDSSPRK